MCVQGNNTINCPRTGGELLTINGKLQARFPLCLIMFCLLGNYFGVGTPKVIVASSFCLSVTPTPGQTQTRLTCTDPGGFEVNEPVFVVQYGGLISSQFRTVSYTQCAAGHYNSGVLCPSCLAGKFSNVAGASFCHDCNPGTFAGSGSTVCTDCAPGLSFVVLSLCCYRVVFLIRLHVVQVRLPRLHTAPLVQPAPREVSQQHQAASSAHRFVVFICVCADWFVCSAVSRGQVFSVNRIHVLFGVSSRQITGRARPVLVHRLCSGLRYCFSRTDILQRTFILCCVVVLVLIC